MDHIRSLRVFAQVVADGSFAGAARTLDLAPAVVTRAISDLENHLGVRLLHRNTRNLSLTDVGEAYLERSKQVLESLADADAIASEFNQAPSGMLRVLCPPAFAAHQLVPRLPAFREQFAEIDLHLAATGAVERADASYDVSIVSVGQQALQGDFVIRPLATSHFLICASPEYLARHAPLKTPEDLKQHDGLLPDVSAVRRTLTLFRAYADGQPAREGLPGRVELAVRRPLLVTAQLELLYSAALAGLGVTGLPTFMAASALREGRLVHLLPEWHGGALQLYAAMPTRKHVPTRTRALIDFLVGQFGGKLADPWLAQCSAN